MKFKETGHSNMYFPQVKSINHLYGSIRYEYVINLINLCGGTLPIYFHVSLARMLSLFGDYSSFVMIHPFRYHFLFSYQ